MKTPPAYELRKLMKRFISNTMRDLKVEGRDEFNRNFERQAFFTEAWARRRYDPDPSRSLLIKSGRLRQSIKSRIEGNTIIYESTEPYAAIHNEGGRIKVTRRMKGYFWSSTAKQQARVSYARMASCATTSTTAVSAMRHSSTAQWHSSPSAAKSQSPNDNSSASIHSSPSLSVKSY